MGIELRLDVCVLTPKFLVVEWVDLSFSYNLVNSKICIGILENGLQYWVIDNY